MHEDWINIEDPCDNAYEVNLCNNTLGLSYYISPKLKILG